MAVTMIARAGPRVPRGRGGMRLDVACRTAFERRIEAKRGQGQQGQQASTSASATTTMMASGTGKGGAAAAKQGAKQGNNAGAKALSLEKKKKEAQAAPKPRSQPAGRRQRFDRDFGFGEQGPHVEKLQRQLLSEGLLMRDSVTGYFGKDTKEALIEWQKKNQVLPSGYLGPVSRSVMNKQGFGTRAKAAMVGLAGPASFLLAATGAVGAGFAVAVAAAAVKKRYGGAIAAAVGSLVAGDSSAQADFEEPSSISAQAPPPSEGGAGAEYSRRVQLRREIASLQNSLGQSEQQVNLLRRELRREKERADRAEALYLELQAKMAGLRRK